MRLRKRTSVLASNGASSRKPGSPIKYCRYGFSAICSTSSRSENWNLVWMIRAPNAMRRGLAILPVSLGNSLAYFTSNSSHWIRSASLTQRLSGFMWSPIGWLKSRNECCNLSIGLYIVLAPLYLKSVRKLQEKRFVFVKILAIIIPENGAKVSKIKCFQFAQQTLYTALYHAASDTLSELAADSKYLGTDIGYICILHTWGSTMNFHPHIHAIVLGGGLDVKNHWKDNGKEFFLPIKVISKIFRGKYMAELKQLWENDRLEFHGSAAPYKNYYTFKELLNTCYTKEWIPYCKKPFDGAESVIRYLGKYTHRIAISNYRIKDMTESTVTFSAKDYKNQGLWKEITISGEEFIRRFLMHVPPKRFVRIRHYGLLSSRNKKKKITLCRNILGCKKYISKLKDMDAPAIIRLLYNRDICKCSSCGGKIIPLSTEQHFIKPKPHMLC